MSTGGVLHVITGLHTGGAEGQLAALAMHNHAAGRDVTVVSLTPGGAHRESLAAAGVPVFDLGMRRGRPSLSALSRLAALIRRVQPAAVQGWMYHADLLATVALILSGRRRATRLFWGVRCSDMDPGQYGAGLRWVIRACAALSRLPDAVVANSETGRDAHRRLGYRPRDFPVIDNGIDTARFRPDVDARAAARGELGLDDATPVLVHVARVDPMKDQATLIAALERLDGAVGLFVGAGTEDLPDRPNIRRLGRRDDVPRLLAAGDAVVCASAFGEGFSNAIAEGMAVGLPAVATDVGDAARLIGDCGRVVPPRDPDALAGAIRAILAGDPKSLGAAARQRIVDNFSMDKMIQAFDRLHGS